MTVPTYLFWDSCVLNAHLYEESHKYDIASIRQFLDDARLHRTYEIFTSSISLAEVSIRNIKLPIGSLRDFLEDYTGQINQVEPSANVMMLAGQLREIRYKKAGYNKSRVLTVPDAIILASCLYLQDAHGIKIDLFHTFDDGKREKTVPLLSFHEWCDGLGTEDMALAQRVCDLKRERPIHPNASPALPPPLAAPALEAPKP